MWMSRLVFRRGLNIPHELTPLISSPHAHPYCVHVFFVFFYHEWVCVWECACPLLCELSLLEKPNHPLP